jgi:nickel/cobalt transporter (NicO) family protein
MKRRILFLFGAAIALAHPMGSFSVNHYTRLELGPAGVDVTYVLDFAETPAYQLLKDWKLDAQGWKTIAAEVLAQNATTQAREWMKGLEFSAGGRKLEPEFVRAEIKLSEGVDALPTARVTSILRIADAGGAIEFEDHNFPDRAGWKEIVIRARGAQIVQASHDGVDRSQTLTRYPAVSSSAPHDTRAMVRWEPSRPGSPKIEPKIGAISQPAAPDAQAAPTDAAARPEQPINAAPTRQDFLARLLAKDQLGFGLILAGLAVAFGLGAVHAMSPGHGKTIVAAYLVGTRGTMRHAAFLGAMVTFTHTISVFALGLATLLLSKYFVPERLIHALEAISGLSIVAIGAALFYKRLQTLRAADRHHHHDHAHDHVHDHDHQHVHAHDHGHNHDHSHTHDHDHDHHHDHGHTHSHGSHTHSHTPEGRVTLPSLIALGVSGGLAPCPSAMVLLLFAISVGRVGLGLGLLVAFSLGLAGVLMAIGMLVLYAKHLLPDPDKTSRHPAFRLVPVLSAAVIVCLGLAVTGASLGWLPRAFAG